MFGLIGNSFAPVEVLIFMVVGLFFGGIGHLIGKPKGRGVAGFWLGLLLGCVGWVIAAILPAKAGGTPTTAPAWPSSSPPPSVTPQTPAGWYPDPMHRFEQRHWNGVAWTEHVSTGGTASTDPPLP